MDREAEVELLKRVIAHYGEQTQVLKLFEEMSELGNAIAQHRKCPVEFSRQQVLTELADVRIMLDQMAIINGISDRELDYEIRFKLWRVNKRVEDEEGEQNDE